MRALVIDEFGPPNAVRVAQMPTPEPADAEIRIKVAYAGVNPADWKEIEGFLKPFSTYEFPFVPGFDGAGTVEMVGAAVSEHGVGDRVMFASGIGQPGTFAEFICLDARQAYAIPTWLEFSQAAVLPTGIITAYQALFSDAKGALKGGARVLIHGGAGGVGSVAIPLAKSASLLVATTCSTSNVSYVASLGADCVIDYTDKTKGIITSLREWAPDGVDAVIDTVSAGTFPDALDALKPGARLVSIATITADGDVKADTLAAERRGFKKIWAIVGPEDMANGMTPVSRLVSDKAIRVPHIEIFELEQASAALLKSKSGHVRGKLCLRISG